MRQGPASGQNAADKNSGPLRDTSAAIVWAVSALLSGALWVYAETRAFVWDEGFHLLAAQLISTGKRPYLDFCFPQTPLNAYWNAAWMIALGPTWRTTHIAAAVLVTGALALFTGYLLRRSPAPGWRIACALTGVLFLGANTVFIQFGPIAQAYAMCLFTGFAAFLLILRAVRHPVPAYSLASGFFAGVACASSLLCAPLAPVLLVWAWLYNEAGSRWLKAAAFACGVLAPFAPVFWLLASGPRQVIFNIVEYQTLFRRADWADATAHDVDVLTSWVDSGQTLLMAMLAIATVTCMLRVRRWNERIRRELGLCAALVVTLTVYISTAHPTFARYYIVAIPFLAVLGGFGVYVAGSRLFPNASPMLPGAALSAVLVLAAFRSLFNDRDAATWQRYEEISKKVAEVTPRGASLYADEAVYFVLHWTPPPGMEFSYSHKVNVSPADARLFHIIPLKELEAEVKNGAFATLETCDDDKIDNWEIGNVYAKRADIADCSVFWSVRRKK